MVGEVGEEAKLKIMLVAVLEENHNIEYVLFKELTNQGEERDRAEIRGGGRVTFRNWDYVRTSMTEGRGQI